LVKLAEPAPVETRTPTLPESTGSADAAPKAASTVTPVDLTAGTSKPAMDANLGRIVYFDFDSFAIKDEFRPVIDGHARALKSSAQKKEIVEGHTDERGGREYNLALGQKRAEAVVKSLVLLGAADSQLEAISYGKERPAVQGSDEAAWAKNRRAELRDR
jgi:peptidoglycan-associated lipoprotein